MMTTFVNNHIRGSTDPHDGAMLIIAMGMVLFLAKDIHNALFIGGAFVAYTGLVIALMILPHYIWK